MLRGVPKIQPRSNFALCSDKWYFRRQTMETKLEQQGDVLQDNSILRRPQQIVRKKVILLCFLEILFKTTVSDGPASTS